MSIDAMKQALEALNKCQDWPGAYEECSRAITALRAAIEQAQEPVAWVGPSWLHPETRTWESESFAPGPIKGWIPLYTAPRQWQGLTNDEIDTLYEAHHNQYGECKVVGYGYERAIEAKLKEKNT